MSKIDDLIEQIEDDRYTDENNREAVDLSDVKRWVRIALEAVKEDLAAQTNSVKEGK